MIITVDKLATMQSTMKNLVDVGQRLYVDIEETARHREQIAADLAERNITIDGLKDELEQVEARNRDLEKRNAALVDDLMKAETQLNEATALLDNVRATVDRKQLIGNAANIAPLRARNANPPPEDRDHRIR